MIDIREFLWKPNRLSRFVVDEMTLQEDIDLFCSDLSQYDGSPNIGEYGAYITLNEDGLRWVQLYTDFDGYTSEAFFIKSTNAVGSVLVKELTPLGVTTGQLWCYAADEWNENLVDYLV